MDEHPTPGPGRTPLTADYELVNSEHGYLLINTHDVGIGEVIARTGVWESQALELMRPYMVGIVVDAGAAIGTHTLEFARTAAHVYAFEPNPVCYYSLCANLLLNHTYNVTTVQAALGRARASIAGEVLDPRQFTSTGGPALGFGDWQYQVVTLDSLGVHPNLVKIDVEGMEVEVLEGMQRILDQDGPVLWLEFHSEELLRQGSAFLRRFHYKPFGTQIVTHKLDDPSVVLCQSMLFGREGAA